MLVAGVAHEINTPLGALNSNHDVIIRALKRLQSILADERVDESELEEVRKIVKAIDRVMATNHMAVDRMAQIVGNLRNFGRVDRAELDRVDLHQGLESTLELLRHQYEGRIEIVREYGKLPLVECYPNQLNQVFMNILVNACQAIQGAGTISLRTRTAGDANVAIEIRDTGTGMAPEDLRQIFEPGFTTKGSRMGMGMGLLISRQIVQRHRGRIDVESTLGEGTAFTIVLPVRLRGKDRGSAGTGPAG
jgi:signal transduction histidine kinase